MTILYFRNQEGVHPKATAQSDSPFFVTLFSFGVSRHEEEVVDLVLCSDVVETPPALRLVS